MIFTKIFIFSLLFFNTLNITQEDKSIFISPVKIPILLSANFGELRIDHFHSGLDIKTQGVTGIKVNSTANGYIYRISISPGGFGKALYVRHPSGYSTVYAHLDKFTPEIEDYVKTMQYEKKSYTVTLFPPRDKFRLSQGDLIAYSGNSGGSSGPHLHYEIRRSESEVPINPLLFEYGKDDNIKPVIEKLVVYPLNRNSLVNDKNLIKKIDVSGGDGSYSVPSENEIRISGLAGFGIKAFDQLNDSYNKCAVYSIELKIDSISIFKYIMDGFSFAESRYINAHIDYETYLRENIYIERTFILPNDKLSVYKDVINRGIFNFNDDTTHYAEIVVTDVHNNKSVLSFSIKSQSLKSKNGPEKNDENLQLMPFNRSNRFASENLLINIPSGALYDTIYFSYQKRSGTKEMLSDIHQLHNKFTPVHKAIMLSIKPTIIPDGKKSKMLIVQLVDNMMKNPIKSTWAEGYLKAEVMSFGNFFIGIDTIPPVISTNGLVTNANLAGKNELKIKVTDDFSGIKSYDPSIDGDWALFEYDQKNNMLIYTFDEKRIAKGTIHNLLLKVTDNMDNFSLYKCDFIW